MEETPVTAGTADSYGSVLRRRVRLIAAIVAIGAPLCLLGARAMGAEVYTATTSVLVRPTTSDPLASTQGSNTVSLATERQILRSSTVAARAVEVLGRQGEDTPADITSRLTVTTDATQTGNSGGSTQVIDLSFEASSPVVAADYAEAIADSYLEYRRETAEELIRETIASIDAQIEVLQVRLDTLVPVDAVDPPPIRVALQRDVVVGQIAELEADKAAIVVRPVTPGEVITAAEVPDEVSGPPVWLNQVGALGLLGLLAVVAAFVVDRRDRHVRGHSELVAVAGPVLTTVPRPSGDHALPAPGGDEAEAYRHLAIRLASTPRRQLTRLLVVTPRGALASEVAMLLAAAEADMNQRALLVPCELDQSPLAVLDLPPMPGFDQALVEHDVEPTAPAGGATDAGDAAGATGATAAGSAPATTGRGTGTGTTATANATATATSSAAPAAVATGLEELVEKVIVPAPAVADLWVAAGGPAVTRSGVLHHFSGMLDVADGWFDRVVLAGPPLRELPNSLDLSCIVDGVVLVFDPSVVERAELAEAVELLNGTSATLLGTVIVDDATWR